MLQLLFFINVFKILLGWSGWLIEIDFVIFIEEGLSVYQFFKLVEWYFDEFIDQMFVVKNYFRIWYEEEWKVLLSCILFVDLVKFDGKEYCLFFLLFKIFVF